MVCSFFRLYHRSINHEGKFAVRLRIAEWAHCNKGWSMKKLAAKLAVEHQTVLYWNQGRTMPRLPMLIQICRLLGCSVEDLIEDEDGPGGFSASL